MRVPRVRLPVPIGTLRQRRYLTSTLTPPSTKPLAPTIGVSSRIWSSVREVSVYPDRKQGPKGLAFTSINEKPLPYVWLRDNCRCNICVNPATRQRNFDSSKLPDNIQPSRWKVGENGLEVQWLHDSHLSFYNWDFLETYIKGERPEPENVPLKYFGAAGHPDSSIEYEEFGKNERQAVGRLTDMIRRNGFALVTGVPTETAATTEDLLEKITFIRRTHYGGFYDFIPDLALADAAYTNEPLPVHTDNTYFSDPAGIQAFHLLSHTDPSSGGGSETTLGGETLLVDGFYAAELLRKECPDSFNTLASFRFPCHASGNEGIAISPDMLYPVLELDLDQNTVHRIRWNPNDRGVIPLGEDTMKWYEAEKKYHEILRREELVYQFQLKPGTVLIFDNWRVLHGRTAFTGMRRICGGYLNRDDFISRWRNTNFGKREIFRQVIGE